MIVASLEHARRYLAVHPLFAEAFAWLEEPANRSRSPGRHAIRDPELLVNVDEGRTQPRAERRFESHRRYLDIQVPLFGGEVIEWAPVAALELEQDFEAGGDIAFYRAPVWMPTRLLVPPGHFAVFLPEDGHRPCCAIDERPGEFRKVVFKLAVEP